MTGAILIFMLFSGDGPYARTIPYKTMEDCRTAAAVVSQKKEVQTWATHWPGQVGATTGALCLPYYSDFVSALDHTDGEQDK